MSRPTGCSETEWDAIPMSAPPMSLGVPAGKLRASSIIAGGGPAYGRARVDRRMAGLPAVDWG